MLDVEGVAVAKAKMAATTKTSWLAVDFAKSVDLAPGKTYTVSVYAPRVGTR